MSDGLSERSFHPWRHAARPGPLPAVAGRVGGSFDLGGPFPGHALVSESLLVRFVLDVSALVRHRFLLRSFGGIGGRQDRIQRLENRVFAFASNREPTKRTAKQDTAEAR